ncbi:MAG TPA: hypothetical protein VFN23_04815, partial [Ktedonobacteraceae bacterium]|nr:hypothetical protein [Ktedonobacteraceae bacterium]
MAIILPFTRPQTLTSPVTYAENSFEHGVKYMRKQEREKVEMMLVHLPEACPVFTLATFHTRNNPNMTPSAEIELSMQE